VVWGDLDLSRERLQKNITSPIRIKDSILDGNINFGGSVIEIPIDLSGSNFTSDVDFISATFRGYANFGRTNFRGDGWGRLSPVMPISSGLLSQATPASRGRSSAEMSNLAAPDLKVRPPFTEFSSRGRLISRTAP
jgi:hypothetical protein